MYVSSTESQFLIDGKRSYGWAEGYVRDAEFTAKPFCARCVTRLRTVHTSGSREQVYSAVYGDNRVFAMDQHT